MTQGEPGNSLVLGTHLLSHRGEKAQRTTLSAEAVLSPATSVHWQTPRLSQGHTLGDSRTRAPHLPSPHSKLFLRVAPAPL